MQAAADNYLDYNLQPKPLIDGIKEAEKYGNEGNPLLAINKFTVGAIATGSQLLNKVVDVIIS